MKVPHLSDQEIQAYVIAEQGQEESVAAHLQSCGVCRNKVLFYQRLLFEVKQLPEPAFDFDLPTLVIERLSTAKSKKTLKWYAITTYVTFLVLVCVTLVLIPTNKPWYFIGANALITWLIVGSSAVLFGCLSIDMFLKHQRHMNMVEWSV